MGNSKSPRKIKVGSILLGLGVFAGLAYAGSALLRATVTVSPDPKIALLSESVKASNPSASPLEPSVAGVTGIVKPFQYQFKVGQPLAVSFSRSMAGQKNGQALPDHELTGKIIFSPVRVRGEVTTLHARFGFNRSKSGLISKAAQQEMGISEVSIKGTELPSSTSTLVVDVNSKGRVLEIRALQKGPSDESVVSMVDIIHSLFFRIPDSFESGRVDQSEDAEGNVRKMQFASSGGDNPIIEGKGVLDTASGSNQGSPVKIEDSLADIDRSSNERVEWNGPAGIPSFHESNSRVAIAMEGKPVAVIDLKLQSKWALEGSSSFKDSEIIAFSRKINVKAIQEKARDDRNLANADRDFEMVRKRLSVISKDEAVSEGENAIFEGVSLALIDNPRLLPLYLKEAQSLPGESRVRSMYLGAIGGLATPEAQRAMVALYQNPNGNEEERERILATFTSLAAPHSKEAKVFLKGLYQERAKSGLGKMAGLSLGHSMLMEDDPVIEREIRGRYASAKAEEDRVYFLQIIGNAKPEHFLAEIKQALASDSVDVRAAGADALRNSMSLELRPLVHEIVRKDPSPLVREMAYHAMLYSAYDAKDLELVRECLSSEKVSGVKTVCYDILLAHAKDPDSKKLIEERLEKESDEGFKSRLNSFVSKE